MRNAIFLLCLFLIKIPELHIIMVFILLGCNGNKHIYIIMVFILLGCNGNKIFVGILKSSFKIFGYTHVDKIICYELPVV